MRTLFVAAWLLGSAALVAGAGVVLIPCGLVLAAGGVLAQRRLRGPAGIVPRLLGIDVRSTARLAALLVTVLGIAWVAAGVRAAV